MPAPDVILQHALQRAVTAGSGTSLVGDDAIRARIELVCRNLSNRALARLLLACALAKTHQPLVDIRKPYTEIGAPDAYSGRTYDESYITRFVLVNSLPCNPTTAFLTPALRNRNTTLLPETNLVGRPPAIYQATLQLLTDVQTNAVSADDLLAETIRWLLAVKAEKDQRMASLLAGLRTVTGAIPLSSEATITLIEQHLKCKGASRLPVLVVAAAYQVAESRLGERVLPLAAHNAAD